VTHQLDLDEIQTMDNEALVRDKLQRAYDVLKRPVIVEDVAAGLDSLGGLPGPFFKFFYQEMGAKCLLRLSKEPNEKMTATCTTGFYDGQIMLLSSGVLHGTVVEPRGTNGFGFDSVIVPDGHSRTMAQMDPLQKREISHRGQAARQLIEQIATSFPQLGADTSQR
ncbi:MAG: non-canonical purine NTP pyrophosphatase, partial [Candidatus Saccharimonadales bacterium]